MNRSGSDAWGTEPSASDAATPSKAVNWPDRLPPPGPLSSAWRTPVLPEAGVEAKLEAIDCVSVVIARVACVGHRGRPW